MAAEHAIILAMTTDEPHGLPVTDGPVPVFDCHVLLAQTDNGYVARTANMDGITATGPTERDALRAIVKSFKQAVEKCVNEGVAIPFRDQPHAPEPGEVERWIPVHL